MRLDIYGNTSYPPMDGANIWPMLMAPQEHNISAAHAALVVSKEVSAMPTASPRIVA